MRSRSSLPTPQQIAETPELVALHALVHALELATRALVATHPDLDGDEAPYWVSSASRARRSALRIANRASRLQGLVQMHIAQHTACAESRNFDLDEDLPF
jgi:hypothetical protein